MISTYPAMGVPPYAAPIAAPVASAGGAAWAPNRSIGGQIGPYIPRAHRVDRSVGGGVGVGAGDGPTELTGTQVVSGAAMDAALFGASIVEPLPSIDAFLESPNEVDASPWVLDEATRQLRGLSAAFTTRDDANRSRASHVVEAYPAWSESDLSDIAMPARSSASFDQAVGMAAMGSRQRPPHAEYAATALEMLARRVRAGELVLPGYDPKTGDAGALVVALAALLGVRLEPQGAPQGEPQDAPRP